MMQLLNTDIQQELLSSTILIVEDNEISRIFLEKTLRQKGFKSLVIVASAEEALAALEDLRPEMIILDIMMPGMDGFECCKAIRAQSRFEDIPVLIQTAITEPELRVKAFAHGASDFISKPVYPQELVARVMVHLQNRHAMKILTHYRDRMARELQSARLLQQSILPGPRDIADIAEFCDFQLAAYYQPSSEIGGDFWGVKRLFPHQAALWLVDFSGHGVASALNAFRLQAYLKEHSLVAARPGEYMALLNEKLLQLLLRGQFATMFYGIVDSQTDTLYYACACTPHPLIVRAESGAVEMLNGSGNPLGIGMHLYPTQTVQFKPGDTLVLYSDALIETPDDNGRYLSEDDVIAWLGEHRGLPAQTLQNNLTEWFYTHAAEALADDLTIVVCQRGL